jgi:hypothetical protein
MAHLRARQKVPRIERVIDTGRSVFNVLHRWTLNGIIGLTGTAPWEREPRAANSRANQFAVLGALGSGYAVYDMFQFNRKRRAEFMEVMSKLESDGDKFDRARIAYINGTADEEQTAMVEEAIEVSKKTKWKLPPILPAMSEDEAKKEEQERSEVKRRKHLTWKEWAFDSLKREEEGEDAGSSERRLGFESLSEEDEGTGVRESDLVRAVEARKESIADKAKAAFGKEKERQRRGGELDQLGLDKTKLEEEPKPAKRRSWW